MYGLNPVPFPKRAQASFFAACRTHSTVVLWNGWGTGRIGLVALGELRGDGVLEQGAVSGDDGEAGGGDEVTAFVFDRVVADDGSIGDVYVTVDDGALDAAVAADVDVGKDDAALDLRLGVDADILAEHGV